MTGTYEWNPMPHKLDVRCPSCHHLAQFEFATIVRIRLKRDVDFFKESPLFDYKKLTDSCGHKWHAAIYYAGLHASSVSPINNLPNGYTPEDWQSSSCCYHNNNEAGSIQCTQCNLRKKHQLNWEHDAYYKVSYKGKLLWAFNRDSANELKKYIDSNDRNIDNYRWRNFLLHIPSVFKKKAARDAVVKLLSKQLK